jgi:hypothetical protein
MSARTKMTAREAFNLNIQDAEMLVELVKMLSNQRVRRMRHELRQRLGDALSVPQKQRNDLECLENERVFVTFKPGYGEWRHRLDEINLRPLLRQALVVACAAVETFCADRVMEQYAATIKEDPLPGRLRDLRLTVGDYLDIQAKYERPAGD